MKNSWKQEQLSRSLKFVAHDNINESKWKSKKKKQHLKEKICKILRKFHNLTRENSLNSTGEYAEFNNELKEILLKIQIEVKI